jgi:hypothetical protein
MHDLESKRDPKKYLDPMDTPGMKDLNVFRMLSFILTIIAVIFLVLRHYYNA